MTDITFIAICFLGSNMCWAILHFDYARRLREVERVVTANEEYLLELGIFGQQHQPRTFARRDS